MLLPVLMGAVTFVGEISRVAGPCISRPDSHAVSVPIDFIDNRFFARWHLRTGGELRLILDTGGGLDRLTTGAVSTLGLKPDTSTVEGQTMTWVRFSHSLGDPLFPAIRNNDYYDSIGRADTSRARVLAGQPGDGSDQFFSSISPAGVRIDGFLGRKWFGERVWTLDYLGHRLLFHGAEPPTSVPAQCWMPLGFQVDSAGHHTSDFPRVRALVDGDSVDFLFDVGATVSLTDSARGLIMPLEGTVRGASFIIHTRFEQWHARHPDWVVIMNSDRQFRVRMIRVPMIEVGGQKIGPVWFSERPDASFHQFMSQWMDVPIDGALGGSAWRYLTVVLDYPRARAAFLTSGAP